VPAPLADDHREAVLWHDAPDVDLTATSDPPPADVDVVVIGGGYCGLSAALELARRDRSVVVVDRGPLGIGASTRNGGMVLPELKAGPASLEARYGELGRRLHGAVEEAFDHVEALVTGPDGIDCDYARTGRLELAFGPASAADLRALAAELDAVGDGARYVEGADLAAELGSDSFPGGLVVERSGGLQPARFHAGLVARARAAGVALHPGWAATELAGQGRQVTLEGGHRIRCRHVLLAVNAHVDAVAPSLRRRVLPMGSFIIATEPLTPEQQRSVLPTGRMVYDTRNLLSYWRLDPDGRMVFGGRKGLGTTTVAQARDFLYERLVRFHPQLQGVRVSRSWGGEVALTRDRFPHCGRVDGAWYAAGCNGSGVALLTWLGNRMAAAICGEALPPFAELSHPGVPLHRLRSAWLPVVSAALRTQDRLGARR
jgi:glycine/D-amino acid oxidase-like deaminating enzyme